jgi:hypothetical protein
MEKIIKIPSSYRYYKLADLATICGIDKVDAPKMLEPVQNITISDFLQTTIDRNIQLPMKNEKAKSELLVMPILSEVWYINKNFKPLSGLTFNRLTIFAPKKLHLCMFLAIILPLNIVSLI